MQYLFINLLPFYSAENVMEIEKVFLDELHVVGKCITESTGFCNSLAILPKIKRIFKWYKLSILAVCVY